MSNLIAPTRDYYAGRRVGVVPIFDVTAGAAGALDAGNSGAFDWNKAVAALVAAGASIAAAQMQANAAKQAYQNAQAQGYNLYQTGYNSSAGSLTQYLPFIAVGILALVLIMRK